MPTVAGNINIQACDTLKVQGKHFIHRSQRHTTKKKLNQHLPKQVMFKQPPGGNMRIDQMWA